MVTWANKSMQFIIIVLQLVSIKSFDEHQDKKRHNGAFMVYQHNMKQLLQIWSQMYKFA